MIGLTEYVEFAIYKILSGFFSLLPRPLCLALGDSLGRLAFRLDRKHRAVALANLAIAFGKQRPPRDLTRLARRSFASFGRLIADLIKISHYSRSQILSLVTSEGRDHLEDALGRGQGALIFTAHIGNWEIAAAPISEVGPLNEVVRVLDNPLLERELARLRSKFGGRLIDKMGAAKPILRALGQNEIVAILIDQNVLRREAIFVDFFGKPAATTPGLASFHLRAGAPLVPIFCHPAAGRKYHLKILPRVDIPLSGEVDEDVLKITQICTNIIEKEIRKNPESWLWIHKRWNTRPADEGPQDEIS
jgi:KDO2-lipid IV(A) lauroyltransferase